MPSRLLWLAQMIALLLAPFGMLAMSPAAAADASPALQPCMEGQPHSDKQLVKLNDCMLACTATLAASPLPQEAPGYAAINHSDLPVNRLGSFMVTVPLPPPRGATFP